jgi:putative transposase
VRAENRIHGSDQQSCSAGALIWNQAHLRRILREYQTHHNQRRPHRSRHGAAPLKPLPEPVDLEQYRIRRRNCVAGLISEYHLAA